MRIRAPAPQLIRGVLRTWSGPRRLLAVRILGRRERLPSWSFGRAFDGPLQRRGDRGPRWRWGTMDLESRHPRVSRDGRGDRVRRLAPTSRWN